MKQANFGGTVMKHDAAVVKSPFYWAISFILILIVCWPLFRSTTWQAGGWISLYCLVLYLSYGIIYLLPSWLLSRFAAHVAGKFSFIIRAVAVGSVGATLVFLYADVFIYNIYGYHINGFVLNLVMTPGGIESLGGSGESTLYFALIAATLLSLPAVAFYLSLLRAKKTAKPHKAGLENSSFKWWPVFFVFFSLTACERVTFSIASLFDWDVVLQGAEAFPLYQPTTFRRLARKIGITVKPKRDFTARIRGGGINYPLKPLQLEPPERPLNIIWLVAESWRWDMLDSEIMPATWAFAQQSQRFTKHYSGGNGTRMGLFSMFYSLNGATWFKMLNANRGPVIMEAIKKEGYQWDMYTSAKFTYPEFDRTIFSEVEAPHLHDDNPEGTKWGNDRRNVGRMLDFIERRDRSRPFMTFMFFESPHARYYFPPENAIRKPYLEELNYATMDLNRDMPLIFNRYVNATNHLDSQFSRIFAYLKEKDLIKDTIVIVSGDHGEEFMEKGHWGHNSEFVEEQIHVPLILSIPGRKPAVYDYMTSHVDIVPTIAPYLGIKNQLSDYSLGLPLFGDERHDYITSAGWGSITIIDSEYKIRLPVYSTDLFKNKISHFDDSPLRDGENYYSKNQYKLTKVMDELGRFLQH